VAVNTFAVISTLYLFNCRSLERSYWSIGLFSNRWIPLGVFLMVLLQLAFTYLPFMNRLFHTEPIGLESWGAIAAAAVVAHFVVGLEKFIARRLFGVNRVVHGDDSPEEEGLEHEGSETREAGA
jgi:Ca2+-transporting ATPase